MKVLFSNKQSKTSFRQILMILTSSLVISAYLLLVLVISLPIMGCLGLYLDCPWIATGVSRKLLWIIPRLSLDFTWTIFGFSMDYPYIISYYSYIIAGFSHNYTPQRDIYHCIFALERSKSGIFILHCTKGSMSYFSLWNFW